MPLPVLRPFRVQQNRPLAREIFALVLAPNDDKPLFEFKAGQWVMLHLPNPDGTTWRAAFSIANAPLQATGTIELAIKLYGDFTRRAVQLHEGDVVSLQGPYGVFTLRPGADRIVLLAAGIGLTPLLSMLRELVMVDDPREVILFYTNKTKDSIAYEEELRDLASRHSRFTPYFFLTAEQVEGWDGVIGRIDLAVLKEQLGYFDRTDYYMCGPKEFMESMKEFLAAEGVDTKARVRKEAFS